MRGLFIYLGLVLLVTVIVAVVVINSDGDSEDDGVEDLGYYLVEDDWDYGNEDNSEQTNTGETDEEDEGIREIDLDMNNLNAECDSPIIKCSTDGCVTQC